MLIAKKFGNLHGVFTCKTDDFSFPQLRLLNVHERFVSLQFTSSIYKSTFISACILLLSVMASNILPPFPSFSVHEDNSSVGSRWKKWFKRFEMYLAAHDVKDSTRKRALLLYSAGEEVSDIFETLPNQGEEKDYQAAVDALNAYFQPQVNKTFEVYKFRNATQDPGEPLDSYHTRLRRLAQLCEFPDEEEEIKSHIILTCSSSRLRRRALRENMNLKAILDYARGLEMAERQAQGIEDKNKVCKVKAKPAQASNTRNNDNLSTSVKKKCYRCGGDFPHQGRPCPALHVSCRNCRKIGHFAKVCRSTPAGPKVNATNEKESDESSDEEYAYGVTINSVKSKKYPTSKVTIRNKTVEFLIDSGAGVNIMDSETYNNINLPLQDTSKKIFGYNADSPLPVLGKFSASVTSKVINTSADVQFYVIQGGGGNLMSYQTATDLGLLHIVNSVSSSEASNLGFKHRKVTPAWPKANGEVERLMRTLEKAIRVAVIEHKSWKQELFTFLRQYRATPHSTTARSPSELLNGRKLKSTLPVHWQEQAPLKDVRQTDANRKERMKGYADKHNHAKHSDLEIGDRVLVKQPKHNKLSTPFSPEPMEIMEKKGSMITAQNADRSVTRNSSFFKKVPPSTSVIPDVNDCDDEIQEDSPTQDVHVEEPSCQLRRSSRTRRLPTHLRDYEL